MRSRGRSLGNVNKPLIDAYVSELSQLAAGQGFPEKDNALLAMAMRLPDVIQQANDDIDEEEWKAISALVSEAVEQFIHFRAEEGKSLEADFNQRIRSIQSLKEAVEPLLQARVQRIRERIQSNFNELQDKGRLDENRFEQEMLFYMEKLDVSEELVRLTAHCEHFLDVMGQDPGKGKKLGSSPKKSAARSTPSEAKPTMPTCSASWSDEGRTRENQRTGPQCPLIPTEKRSSSPHLRERAKPPSCGTCWGTRSSTWPSALAPPHGPRGTEQDEVDYHFLTVDAFKRASMLERCWSGRKCTRQILRHLAHRIGTPGPRAKSWYSMWTWSVEPTCVACSVTARWPYSSNRLRWKCSAIGWKAEERTTRIGLRNGWPKPNGSWSSTLTSTKSSSTMI